MGFCTTDMPCIQKRMLHCWLYLSNEVGNEFGLASHLLLSDLLMMLMCGSPLAAFTGDRSEVGASRRRKRDGGCTPRWLRSKSRRSTLCTSPPLRRELPLQE